MKNTFQKQFVEQTITIMIINLQKTNNTYNTQTNIYTDTQQINTQNPNIKTTQHILNTNENTLKNNGSYNTSQTKQTHK